MDALILILILIGGLIVFTIFGTIAFILCQKFTKYRQDIDNLFEFICLGPFAFICIILLIVYEKIEKFVSKF